MMQPGVCALRSDRTLISLFLVNAAVGAVCRRHVRAAQLLQSLHMAMALQSCLRPRRA